MILPRALAPLGFRTALVLLSCLPASAAERVPLANAYARTVLSLNGTWRYLMDPYDSGYFDYRSQPFDQDPHPKGGYFLDIRPVDRSVLQEYDFDAAPTLLVPRDWNSQAPQLLYYEGAVWYRRRFDVPAQAPGHRLFLHFGAANYTADVYLNGKKLGRHVGGFTPFDFEVTGAVRPADNSLVVRVNNTRHADAVPTVNTDWWNYGGLTRDVLLLSTPRVFVSEYTVRLDPHADHTLELAVTVEGAAAGAEAVVRIPELGLAARLPLDAMGRGLARVPAPPLQRWSPQHPKLYDVELACGEDHLTDRIGFRTIEVRGADILLNGEPIFLRGASVHEENPLRGGRACTREDARMLLQWAKELNANFLRLAHYPHSEFMARLADEMGILLWEEIPVYWTIQWENPATLANARAQLAALIGRDHNRASVIIWSVANETPITEARTRFLRTLVEDARRLDGSRLVSAAMEIYPDPANPNVKVVADPFGAFTDLTSFNEYVGWYEGASDHTKEVRWDIRYHRPVVISEFGGDALAGLHGDRRERFTEEYQEDLYRQTLRMLSGIPELRGMTPWCLCDFRSPRRQLTHVQDGWNRKGLIGSDGARKKAFYVLQAHYAALAAAGR